MFDPDSVGADYAHFSSEVRLELRVQGQSIPLAGIGPSEVTPRSSVELPPCTGEILMTVDGQTVHWKVNLPNGAVPFDRTIRADSI